MICAGAANSNVGHHLWPQTEQHMPREMLTDLAKLPFSVFHLYQLSEKDSLQQFPQAKLPRICHIYGKIGTNVTRQLKSPGWIGSSDSLYNPEGQVLPWQQLALSWAGKAYKQMITRMGKEKNYVRAKRVRKEHTNHPHSSAALGVKKASKSSHKRQPEAWGGSRAVGRKWPWIHQDVSQCRSCRAGVCGGLIALSTEDKTNNRAAAGSYSRVLQPTQKAQQSASSEVKPWGSNSAADGQPFLTSSPIMHCLQHDPSTGQLQDVQHMLRLPLIVTDSHCMHTSPPLDCCNW